MTPALMMEDTEYAVRLRMQRAVLTRVSAEIAGAARRVPPSDGSWRSDAQRAYARALVDLEELLRNACAALGVAVSEVDRALAEHAIRAD